MREIDILILSDAVKEQLKSMGEDPKREGLIETPDRVAEYFRFMTTGNRNTPPKLKDFSYEESEENYSGSEVTVQDIPFVSLCEHHLLPFIGKASISYTPKDKIVGLSKFARVVEHFSKRIQTQEVLTRDIAEYIFNNVDTDWVAVTLEAEHLCMTIRGVQKPGTTTLTTSNRFRG